jgi:leucyl-tRNA synthetase
MEYNFSDVEKVWQQYWREHKTFRAEQNSAKPKYYVLDMFPYPSGAGLHVGHPLGYIASDIYARYKRLKGFNVLHPMGYDSFGLPAEQYAIQTGQHPAITTETNIARYREQLDKIGFSFDWDREVRTSNPDYYKWTQWIFIKLFHSWYNPQTNKAEPVEKLIEKFKGQEAKFNIGSGEKIWDALTEKEQSHVLMDYRLAYLSETYVNWCPALGTVLANEEVKDGLSERGGHPVERKRMPQWSLRITAYADRLLNDLEALAWSDSIKEAQRNWIGKSEGSSLQFDIEHSALKVEVFTTRPDTVFGVTFITLAPEHELIEKISAAAYKQQVEAYIHYAKNRSERERISEVKKITGQFTGTFVIHPFTKEKIPVWIGDYVLAGYGTGAVMGVPAHDARDHAFATHFAKEGLAIKQVITAPDGWDILQQAWEEKQGTLINSGFLNGLEVKAAIKKCIAEIEHNTIGKGKTNYRLRDAIFGRQRYWGEPIPVYYKNGIPYTMDEDDLPLVLPEVDKYLPTETGEPPLARAAATWKYKGQFDYETTTMPGWAGSSWYYLRYMDAHNDKALVSKEAVNYWQDVDLYIGGSEHATGHLLYVRFWTKFLNDIGVIPTNEPAKKLINQGMIQGVSKKIVRIHGYSLGQRNSENTDLRAASYITNVPNVLSEIINKALEKNGGIKWNYLKEPGKVWSIYLDENMFLSLSKDNSSSLAFSHHNVPINFVSTDFENGREYYHLDLYEYCDFVKGDDIKIFVSSNGLKVFGSLNDNDFNSDEFKFSLSSEVEKMSKSKWNVVTPDDIIEKYGADCLRMYEMFLGPLEQSKPWNTNGISGVSGFIRKLWKLYHKDGVFAVSNEAPSKAELKVLHKTIKKVQEDIEKFSFNTSVSSFMICVNELTDLKCNKREILEPLSIILSPYAPHIAEELWRLLGHNETITYTDFPEWKTEYLTEDEFEYPVSVNGKTRFKINLPLNIAKEEIEKQVLATEELKKYTNGTAPKKVIVVPGRIVNIVV